MKYKIPMSIADFENAGSVTKSNENKNADKKKTENVENENTENAKGESQNKKQAVDRAVEYLKNLKNEVFDKYVGDNYNFEYLKTDDRTDEELEKTATSSAMSKKQDSQKSLTEEAEEKKKKIDTEIQEQTKNYNDDIVGIEKTYENAKQSASDQAIKRGLGRSSIIMNMLKEYDTGKIKSIETREQSYKTKIGELDEQIKTLDENLDKALKNLDMQTAFEINEQLDALKKERDENNQKAIKYNNELNKILGAYKKELATSDEGAALIEQTQKTADNYKKQIVLDLMDYYDGLSLNEAKKDFIDSGYADVLDDNYTKLIQNYFSTRNG